MKIAPLVRAINRHNERLENTATRIEFLLVHTGQHYDIEMSFFRDLVYKTDINLSRFCLCLTDRKNYDGFEAVCLQSRLVVVVGDVNSTMACTLVAAKMGIKVAHVEAGRWSFDRSMPRR
jgi:UDP-N-acetylglucosamine 2-epimerase (non-hydrolysing)